MQDLINFIVQNGIGVVCVAYLIYFQSTTMKEMYNTLSEINQNLQNMNIRMENVEKRLDNQERKD